MVYAQRLFDASGDTYIYQLERGFLIIVFLVMTMGASPGKVITRY
jgi:hypothetical protein